MRKYLFPLLLAGVGILPAQAELADRDKPMFIEADTMRYDDANKVTNATGRVVATKGTLVLRADAVEVRQDDTGKSFVVATSRAGNQALMRQKREGLNEFFEAQANRIERDEKTQIARLLGKAVMRRLVGDTQVDEVRGDTIVYNEATEVYNVSGGAQTAAFHLDGCAPFLAPVPQLGRLRRKVPQHQRPSGSPCLCSPAPKLERGRDDERNGYGRCCRNTFVNRANA